MDYEKHLIELRVAYVKASPKMRLNVALERIENPTCGANQIIQIVSAVEGLARSLAVHLSNLITGEEIDAAYKKLKLKGPKQIIEYICEIEKLNRANLFPEEQWELFEYAIKYRNLLIHECTFLGQDKFPQLIDATLYIFEKLREIYKLK